MKIKKGDFVQVIAGKDKGKQGEVLKVFIKEERVVVEGINIVTKHLKPSQMNPEGGKIEKSAPIHISNVMIVDPKSKKPTRVGYEIKDGKKVRIAKKSGQTIDKAKK